MRLRLFVIPFFLIALFARASAAEASRPNILWLVTEDNSATFVSGYGDPLARTPNFSRLARGGILFERAYSTSAVCAPTRASIITGMYATTLGNQAMRSEVTLPPWLRFFPAYLREAGYFTTNRAKTDYNAAVLPGTWDQNGNQAHYRNRKSGQPFFAVFNFNASHESSLHKRVALQTDPAKVRVPAYLPDTPEVRADIAQYYDRVAEADRLAGEVLAQLEADGLAEDTIVFYYSDHGGALPRGKRFLYENGTHPPLVVRFPKKFQHLAPGEPGTRSRELVNWVDLAPTVLSLTGVKAPDFLQGRAFAGPSRAASPEFTYSFRDRMDERIDLSRAVTDGRWRYIRHYRPELPVMQHLNYLWQAAGMKDWARLNTEGKLTPLQASYFRPKPVEELFDCEADPDNVRNLAHDPAHQATLLRLRAANRAHLLRTRDTGFIPESLLRELSGERSPAEVLKAPEAYPLERVLDTLDRLQLAPELSASDSTLNAALNDAFAPLRFWAAVAALRLPTPAAKEKLTPLLADPVPAVRLAAAFALARTGGIGAEQAWLVFSAALANDQRSETKLEALNYLTLLPQRPASLTPSIVAASKGPSRGENYVARAAEFLAQ